VKIFIDYVAVFMPMTWVFTALLCRIARAAGRTPPGWAPTLVGMLKWPALMCYVWNWASDLADPEAGMLNHAVGVLNLVVWWLYRNDGDDDWKKKMKKKLAEKVTRVGARLVVVPAR